VTAAAWADYMERNRRSNVIYDHLPIALHNPTATPCHVCRTRLTQRASGLCKDCEEKK
jgi:hypothetical protein